MSGVLTLTRHVGYGPTWDCERCGQPWPCSAFRSLPRPQLDPAALTEVMSFLLRDAIRDLPGRPEGPEPPRVVRRFLWFLPLTDSDARAIARRMR